jgi:hypothetical protein
MLAHLLAVVLPPTLRAVFQPRPALPALPPLTICLHPGRKGAAARNARPPAGV